MNGKSARLPLQEGLFDDGRESNAAGLVSVNSGGRKLNAVQRQFNRLTARVRRARDSLAAWDAFIPRFQARVMKELQPIEKELRSAQRRVVQLLHDLLTAPQHAAGLSRRDGARARRLLLLIIGDLLGEGPDAELEALHDRYSDIPHAERRRQELRATEALIGGIFGRRTVKGHKAQNVDELLRHASEKLFEGEARRREQSDRSRGQEKRRSGAAASREQAAQEASRSVREVYRRLASALHPDREADAGERERKTVLMQRANQAYERTDLLGLLALQIEIEQIDDRALAEAPEARLRHYNQVLLEQAEALEAQVEERIAAFRMEFDLTAHEVTTRGVDQALDTRIVEARARLKQIERDGARLIDPAQRRAVLDELAQADAEVPDLEQLAALDVAFDSVLGGWRQSKRRSRRNRR